MGDDFLEFNRICSGRFGLLEAEQLISCFMLEVPVQIHPIEGHFEGGVIFAVEGAFYFRGSDVFMRCNAMNEGDNVQDLLKKLPGVKVDRDGIAKAQGEKV